jgi:DNA phosphorothioation-associated putative methyltransferase
LGEKNGSLSALDWMPGTIDELINEPRDVRSNALLISGRTAISRTALLRPLALALKDGIVSSATSVFDYGCGRGGDVDRLCASGISARGWDPVHAPDEDLRAADVVNLGYVVNVIEDPNIRQQALASAWALAKNVLIVSARLLRDRHGMKVTPRGDGYITSTGTFQKFFEQEELCAWVNSVLGVQPVSAAPGVLYVWRDKA